MAICVQQDKMLKHNKNVSKYSTKYQEMLKGNETSRIGSPKLSPSDQAKGALLQKSFE